MRKIILAFIVLCVFAISISMINAASINQVSFNGNFTNGTTLYSNSYDIINASLYGRDVYPIRTNCTNQTYNVTVKKYSYENQNITKTRNVCHSEIEYLNKTKTTCRLINHTRNCTTTEYQVQRRHQACKKVEYQFPKRIIVVTNLTVEKTRVRCDSLPAGCDNPTHGFTNQLALENFKMSFDGGSNWDDIPYGVNQTWVGNADLSFRVDIPAVCFPSYNVNGAIYFVES